MLKLFFIFNITIICGMLQVISCPPGRYISELNNCVMCPSGYYCSNLTEKPIICPEGFFCPYGTGFPFQCTVGVYCPVGSYVSNLFYNNIY